MADNKKGFVLYADNKSMVDMLSDEQAGKLMKIIFQYVNDENPILDDILIKLAFEPIKLQLKRDLKKYEKIKEKRSFAGRKSAEIRKQKAANLTHAKSVEQTSTNPTVIDNVNVNVKDNVKESVIIDKSIKEDNNIAPVFKLPLATRKRNFQSMLFELDAPDSEKLKFFDYWTTTDEYNRMRWEEDKFFSINLKLRSWIERSKTDFNKNKNGNKQNNKQASTFLQDSKREYSDTPFGN